MSLLDVIMHLGRQFGPVILFTIAVFLLLEAIVLAFGRRRQRNYHLNYRLKVIERVDDRQAALEELRRVRGLTRDGGQLLPFASLNSLITQSGIGLTPASLGLFAMLSGGAAAVLAFALFRSWPTAVLAALACGAILPLLVLKTFRRRRIRQFENQLPDAVDVMVRSLRAGHPVAVAISLVAREMADPVGSEFGIASDEMTYGLDLESALVNLRDRTGQGDLGFLVVAISIQSKTGGNLAEILTNLSTMIRARFKMRRKISAISAEGRFSALGLSSVPVMVFLALRGLAPTYYGEIADHPVVMPIAYLTFGLWLTGVVIMHRMINFRF